MRHLNSAEREVLAEVLSKTYEMRIRKDEGDMKYSEIRGFNYQPSYGSTGFELWQYFDAAVIDIELGRGRTYFPGMNAVRWWLSVDSYLRNPQRFLDNFDQALHIAARHDVKVMPVLFNRWHNAALDYGGVYQDYFHPREVCTNRIGLHREFVNAVVSEHAVDDRIFCWDLCNEPFDNRLDPAEHANIIENELL